MKIKFKKKIPQIEQVESADIRALTISEGPAAVRTHLWRGIVLIVQEEEEEFRPQRSFHLSELQREVSVCFQPWASVWFFSLALLLLWGLVTPDTSVGKCQPTGISWPRSLPQEQSLRGGTPGLLLSRWTPSRVSPVPTRWPGGFQNLPWIQWALLLVNLKCRGLRRPNVSLWDVERTEFRWSWNRTCSVSANPSDQRRSLSVVVHPPKLMTGPTWSPLSRSCMAVAADCWYVSEESFWILCHVSKRQILKFFFFFHRWQNIPSFMFSLWSTTPSCWTTVASPEVRGLWSQWSVIIPGGSRICISQNRASGQCESEREREGEERKRKLCLMWNPNKIFLTC